MLVIFSDIILGNSVKAKRRFFTVQAESSNLAKSLPKKLIIKSENLHRLLHLQALKRSDWPPNAKNDDVLDKFYHAF